MTTEPALCPCGCGIEREEAIAKTMEFLGWSRERVEYAMAYFENEESE